MSDSDSENDLSDEQLVLRNIIEHEVRPARPLKNLPN